MTEKAVLKEIERMLREGERSRESGEKLWTRIEPLFQRTLPRTNLAGQVHKLLRYNNTERAVKLIKSVPGRPIPVFLIPMARALISYGLVYIGLHVLGLALIGYGQYDLKQAEKSVHWKSVPGRIIESRVVVSRSRNSEGRTTTSRTAKIVYEYDVDGKIRRGNKVRFGIKKLSDVSLYPRGADVFVYFDPQKPKNSVLEKGVNEGTYLPTILGGFILVGSFLVGIVMRFWKRRKKRKKKEARLRKK